MRPTLTVYIDEAGDPGVRDGLRYSSSRHEWLCLSAVVVRSMRSPDLPVWVREMRDAAKSTQAGSLHYHRILTGRRSDVCQTLASKPCRAFVLATHKSNMREYVNDRIGAMISGGKFYNWCLRLLLERVTAWAEEWQKRELDTVEALEVVFAQRGHDYEHFFSYIDLLKMQKQADKLFLKGPGLAPALLDRSRWSVIPAADLAGLQLADTVASAFYQAANVASPTWDVTPAQRLKPIIMDKNGCAANVGVTVFPLPHQATLPEEARPIFRTFGYEF